MPSEIIISAKRVHQDGNTNVFEEMSDNVNLGRESANCMDNLKIFSAYKFLQEKSLSNTWYSTIFSEMIHHWDCKIFSGKENSVCFQWGKFVFFSYLSKV